MERPTLHDLANSTGFGSGLKGIREHYDPHWGLAGSDPKAFRVKINYTVTTRDVVTYDVEAADEKAAEKIALDLFDNDISIEGDEIDVGDISIKERDA